MQYEITITEKHLDLALKQSKPDEYKFCLVAQAVAERMGYNMDTMITGFVTFGEVAVIKSESDNLAKLIRAFDHRFEHQDSDVKLRKVLPQTFHFESLED